MKPTLFDAVFKIDDALVRPRERHASLEREQRADDARPRWRERDAPPIVIRLRSAGAAEAKRRFDGGTDINPKTRQIHQRPFGGRSAHDAGAAAVQRGPVVQVRAQFGEGFRVNPRIVFICLESREAGVEARMRVWCGEEASMPAQKTRGLPDRMRAVVAHGPGEFRFEEVDRPYAGEGEIVIRVEACGICAGDLKSFHGAPSFWGGEGNPPYIDAPVIPGHEFIGHIVELGDNVDAYAHHGDTGFELGDRVISEQIVPTWTDRFSTTGRYWMDERHYVYGFQKAVNGGFAEYMKFPKEAINYKVPHDIPTEKAVLIEPYACSKHGVDRASITGEDIVVISGAGVIGLGMVGAAKLRNPAKLIVLDLNDKRLERARQFGADLTMNPSREDVIGKIRELSGGYGCDKYIEVTGHPASVQQGLEALRKMGTFVEFSVFKDLVTVDWSIISDRKELDVLGGHLSPYCYRPVIDWIESGELPTDGVVTHRLPLEEWESGFEMVDKGDESIKVILEPERRHRSPDRPGF